MTKLFYLSLALTTLMLGCSSTPTNTANIHLTSETWSNARQMVFECDSSTLKNVPCRFGLEGGGKLADKKQPAFFQELTSQQQYLKRLIGLSASNAAKNPKTLRETPVSDSDVPLLNVLAGNQDSCLADREYADFLVACSLPSRKEVVLFFRGLCDRCEFQPVILKNK
jgi:hypothetical protein